MNLRRVFEPEKLKKGVEPACADVLRHRTLKPVLLVSSLMVAALLIAHGISRGEFNLNIDEAYNAFTGLFFADFYRHLPLAHPVQYAYSYYAHYPAVMLFHWPPLLHLIEGNFFLLLGPSVVSARLTILAFALMGLFFWFKLVCLLENMWAACVSTILLACLPQVLLFEKAVMSEAPCLALCIAAIYFWTLYLREANSAPLYAFAIFAALALLTKQHSAYLAVFCLLSAVTTRRWRLLWRWPIARALGLVLLLVGPFYAWSLAIDRRSISGNVFHGAEKVVHPHLFYLSALPQQVGWPVLGLALAGLVTCRWWTTSFNAALMLSWIAGTYSIASFLATKDVRYTIYLLPPLLYFAVGPVTSETLYARSRLAGPIAALVLVLVYSIHAWRFERPYVAGYAPAAESFSQVKGSQIILYDGDLGANFMFFLRLRDPSNRFIVLRKALYTTAVMKRFGAEELIRTPAELEDLIQLYGIRYVIVEDPVQIEFDAQKVLRDLLNTPRFRLLHAFPLESNVPSLNGRRVVFYENTEPVSRSAHFLRVRMLTLGHDIVIPLGDGG